MSLPSVRWAGNGSGNEVSRMIATVQQVIRGVFQRKAAAAAKRLARFEKGGRIPWSTGYNDYKWRGIQAALAHPDFMGLVGSPGFGYRIDERIVELPWLLSRLPAGPGVLLDAGSALNHGPVLDHPRLAEKRVFISTLAPERKAYWERGISYVYEDLRQTCFREACFDLIACVSTLEHVGLDNTFLYTDDSDKKESDGSSYLDLIEVFRTRLKPGGRLFLTLPYGRRIVRGWFQVFDGPMLDAIVARFAPTEARETMFMYRDDRWCLSNREEARDATCFDVHVDPTPPPDYCAFSRAVVCLELKR